MDNIETPYEEETEFIDCKICEKSIRGETLFKIHLTTPGHIKPNTVIDKPVVQKRMALLLRAQAFTSRRTITELPPGLDAASDAVASGTWIAGLVIRQNTIPAFEDILHYLDYMKLDEPIIGLSYLDEVSCNDPQAGPRYMCRLCHQTANLAEMVRHLIGRKHRQKYVELKRPDLVTWDKQSIITQGGKIIRARAEIIERQDGRGSPSLLPKMGTEGKLNISRVPPRNKQNGDRNISESLSQRDVPSHLPELDEYSRRGRYRPGYSNTPPLHPEDPHMVNSVRQMYQREDTLSHDSMENELQRADYRKGDMYRQEYMEADYHREYEEEYVQDPQRRAVLEPGSVPRYDLRAEMPHGQAQHVERYQDKAPPYRRPYPENDLLKEFCSEEVRHGRVCSAEYQPSQSVYSEADNHWWSLDRESGRRNSRNVAGRQELREQEAKRRRFPTPTESEQSHDHLFGIIRDYCHEMREPRQEGSVANTGPSRTEPSTSQRRVEVTRAMSDIPEPFRVFLKGAANDEGHGKRKRKSRFSDATSEEVKTTKEMFSDEYGPPNPKFEGHPRPVSALLRPEIYGTQHPDLYIESQSPHQSESFQRGCSVSGGVFDMLKNIDIENAEEADFLKDKLCNLLKEFKTKKSERAGQNNHSRTVISKDYNSLKWDPELSPRRQYETVLGEDSDLRRPEDFYFKEAHRGRAWTQHEHLPDERLQEHHHRVRGDPRHSNRSHYEDVFGSPDVSRTPRYPDRFQEPLHPRDNQPATEGFLDSHSSAPPLHTERRPRMDRGPRYSNSLDKITSTLLELVARK